MYIIDRLFMTQQSCKEDTDYDLANYFLKNLNRLSNISLKVCIKESHVSKASLHRFYTKGGFKNYKDFIFELSHEYERIRLKREENKNELDMNEPISFSTEMIKQFMRDVKKAGKIYFYGHMEDIHKLEDFHYYLIKHEIEIFHLLQWDTQWNHKKIDELGDDDVFIVVDSQYNLSVLIEKSVVQSDMLNLIDINNKTFKKYFIGIDSQHSTSFQSVATFQSRCSFSRKIGLLYLDKQITCALEDDR